MGIITNPKKALYNKVYNKATVSVDDLLKPSRHLKTKTINSHKPTQASQVQIDAGNIIRSSSRALTVTSKNFVELREQIASIYSQRVETRHALQSAKSKLNIFTLAQALSYILIFGFFFKGLSQKRIAQKQVVAAIEQRLTDTYVSLNFADKSQLEKSWLNCLDAFQELMGSRKIWDVTYSEVLNRVQARTIASTAITRTAVSPISNAIEFIKSDLDCLALPNANGPNIFIYPTFLILFKDYREFGIFDLKEIKTSLKLTRFVEEEGVPNDSEVVDQTWKKTNKDGSRDKRFNGNYEIPIAKYGEMNLESDSGLQEYYLFSNFAAFSDFAKAYAYHLGLLEKRN